MVAFYFGKCKSITFNCWCIMIIENVDIKDLKPYKKNAKLHPKSQIEQIKKSILEFGNNDPIGIDENNVIIEGHGRYIALKELGYTNVPVIRLNHLSEEEKKAYILVHNKLTMNSDFDIGLLDEELDEIMNIDMEEFGFVDEEESVSKPRSEHHRENTFKSYNLNMIDLDRCDGKYQMPHIEKEDFIPDDIIGFNYMLSNDNKNVGIHCFIDDYQFERLWNNPKKYLEKIQEYDCIFTPDFSLYTEMPLSMKIWNVFRSRLIGQWLQDNGCVVIPTISWCEEETFEFCFDGLEIGGTVAVSTIGVKKTNMELWVQGMNEMIDRLKPKTILVYGGKVDYDYGNVNVVYFDNKVTERMKNI